MVVPTTNSNEEREYFTPLHHEIAALMGYKQTPGYATWDKVEETAPVQVIDRFATYITSHVQTIKKQERIQTASDIFNLAHEYASRDKTMRGAEELHSYHYYNAIHKIGEFDGR